MGRGRWRGDRFDLPLLVIYLTPCHLFRENLRTLSKLYSQLVVSILLYTLVSLVEDAICGYTLFLFFFDSNFWATFLSFFFLKWKKKGVRAVNADRSRIPLLEREIFFVSVD